MIKFIKNLAIGNVLFLGFVYGIFHFNQMKMKTIDFITFSFLISSIIIIVAISIVANKKLKIVTKKNTETRVKINRKKD